MLDASERASAVPSSLRFSFADPGRYYRRTASAISTYLVRCSFSSSSSADGILCLLLLLLLVLGRPFGPAHHVSFLAPPLLVMHITGTGLVWYGLVWYSLVWSGLVWSGMISGGLRRCETQKTKRRKPP